MPDGPVITSRQNATIQLYRSLRDASARRRHGLYLIEGPHAVAEAVRCHVPFERVLWSRAMEAVSEGTALLATLRACGVALQEVDGALIDYVASTESPQGVVAVAPIPERAADALVGPGRFVLVLDGVSDPGNVGTLVRSAAAAGADGVLLWGAACDPWNPKCVRASVGVVTWFPVCRLSTLSVLSGMACMATSSHQGQDYGDVSVDFQAGVALIVGNEARGVSEQVAAMVSEWLRIPLASGVESLNAGVAGSVLLFHFKSQRDRLQKRRKVR